MVESSFLQTRGETMLRRTKNILKSLRNCRSGNAVMIVALASAWFGAYVYGRFRSRLPH